MTKITTFALISLLPLLGACADMNGKDIDADEGKPAPHFGEALKRDMAAQIVNPEAPVTTEPQTMDGARAGVAQEAYSKDKVKQPEEVGLSNNLGSGGSNGTSSGGSSSQ